MLTDTAIRKAKPGVRACIHRTKRPYSPYERRSGESYAASDGFKGRQTTHGFRHLVSTALKEKGYESDWVERQLAHGDPDKIRGTYNKAM